MLSNWVKDKKDAEDSSGVNPVKLFFSSLGEMLGGDKDDSHRMFVLTVSFVVGAFFFQLISGFVQSDALKDIRPWLSVPPAWRYLVIAIFMAVAVWFAKEEGAQ